MKPPLFVRALSNSARTPLEQGLRSRDRFTLRPCQLLLASAKHQRPKKIAAQFGCSVQKVRNTIRAFHEGGLNCLQAQSSRPKTSQSFFAPAKQEQAKFCATHESGYIMQVSFDVDARKE